MAGEKVDIPLFIGGKEVRTGTTVKSVMPHDFNHVLGDVSQGHRADVTQAIDAAEAARAEWSSWSLRRSRRGDSQSGRAADHELPRHRQRRHDARPVENGVPGGDRRHLRADRLLALQRRTTRQELLDEQPVSHHAMWNQLDYPAASKASSTR